MAYQTNDRPSWGWGQWLLLLGLLLSLAMVGVFTIRGLHSIPRRQADEPIRSWMNCPYIARSYRVPPSVLFEALGLPPNSHDRRPLSAIARAQNRPVSAVIADVQNAIARARAPSGLPSPTPTRTLP